MNNRPQAAAQPTKSPFGSITTREGRPGFYVRFRWSGRRLWKYVGPRRDVAARNVARLHALLADGKDLEDALAEVFRARETSGYTFKQATGDYLAWAATRKKATTLARDRRRLTTLSAETWATLDLAHVRRHHIQRHIDAGLAAGRSAASCNRDVAIVSALYRWAIAQRHVAENPTKGLLKPSEAGNDREVYLTRDETKLYVSCAAEPFRSVLLAAFHTGTRKGELLALRWSDVDLDAGTLRVIAESAKSREGRTVPLTPALRARLLELRAERGNVLGGPVFAPEHPGEAEREYLAREGLRLTKAAAAKLDGIDADKLARFRFHDARHTAASLMVAQGVPLFDVGKILGHKSPGVTMRYAHFAPEAGRAAIAALARALA